MLSQGRGQGLQKVQHGTGFRPEKAAPGPLGTYGSERRPVRSRKISQESRQEVGRKVAGVAPGPPEHPLEHIGQPLVGAAQRCQAYQHIASGVAVGYRKDVDAVQQVGPSQQAGKAGLQG